MSSTHEFDGRQECLPHPGDRQECLPHPQDRQECLPTFIPATSPEIGARPFLFTHPISLDGGIAGLYSFIGGLSIRCHPFEHQSCADPIRHRSNITSEGKNTMPSTAHSTVHALPRSAGFIETLEARKLMSLSADPAFWSQFGGDAQHSAISPVATQALQAVHWQTKVDQNIQLSGGEILAHYGSPVITAKNTVLVPVKTGANGNFQIDAIDGATGHLKWIVKSDFIPSPGFSTNTFSPALTRGGRLYFRPPAGPSNISTLWMATPPPRRTGRRSMATRNMPPLPVSIPNRFSSIRLSRFPRAASSISASR